MEVFSPDVRIFSNFATLIMTAFHYRILRKCLAVAGMLLTMQAFSQIDCKVYMNLQGDPAVYENDTVLCRGQRLTLFAQYADTLQYFWEPGGETSDQIEVKIDTVERVYTVYINNIANTVFCSDSIKLTSYIIPNPKLADSVLCYNDTVSMGTKPLANRRFNWRPGNQGNFVYQELIKDTTTYYLDVYRLPVDTLLCTDSIKFYTYPRIIVEFNNVNKACPDSCNATAKGNATGGFPPYNYVWRGYEGDYAPDIYGNKDYSWPLELCVDDPYTFRVMDTVCIFDTVFSVDPLPLPTIEFSVSPDTIYPTNPKAEFSFENTTSDSIPIDTWRWLFPDSTYSEEAVATFVFLDSATTVKFAYTTLTGGCPDTLDVSVIFKPFEKPKIYNVFTPNGDGFNDYWEIPDLKYYISNEVVVFDRWGRKVFEANNYSNNWDGGDLDDGVYYYILRCVGFWKEDVFRGSVTILGNSQ